MPSRRSNKLPTVGSFPLDHLYDRGVHHAFGIPGDYALPFFHRLEQSKIDLINMTHEACVGFAADAYARLRGLGLACITFITDMFLGVNTAVVCDAGDALFGAMGLRKGQATVVHTKGQLDGALTNAVSSKDLSIIEIRLPRTACSPALRRLGQELARLRTPGRA